MPDRYGDQDQVVDFDSHRRAREAEAIRERARQQRERLGETRTAHAGLTAQQADAVRAHRQTVTTQAEKRRKEFRIANCGLCDDDGYRGPVVCDHVDRAETTQRGLAKCHEVLAQIAAKKGTTR